MTKISVKEKLRLSLLEQIKKVASERGENAYELCDPDNPEEGPEVVLPGGGLAERLWFITSLKKVEDRWFAEITPATPSVPETEVELDTLNYKVLGQIKIRIDESEVGNLTNYHFTCPDCGNEWEDRWTCAASDRCPECNATTEPDQEEGPNGWESLSQSGRFVLQMAGDVEPVIHGPYFDDQTVLAVAKRLHNNEPDDTICRIIIDWEKHTLHTSAFSHEELD